MSPQTLHCRNEINPPMRLLYSSLDNYIGTHVCHLPPSGYGGYHPSWYAILLQTEYEDITCYPPSSVNRSKTDNPVLCQYQYGSAKLLDFEVGSPSRLPSPATDVAYILSGTSPTGLPERWIEFVFGSPVTLYITHILFHYYCTGTPPQLLLTEEFNVCRPGIQLLCGGATYRRALSIDVDINHSSTNISLFVKRNGGQFYLYEVEFIQRDETGE